MRTPVKLAAPSTAALLILALLPAGCTKPAPADDASLTAAVQSRLAADTALGSGPIQASVQGGIATLSGNVSSDAARALAANDTAQVAGIRTVVNNLSVQAPAPPQAAIAPVPAPIPLPAPAAPEPSRRERDRDRKRPSRAAVVAQPSQARASAPSADADQAQNTPPPPRVVAPPPPVKAAPAFRDVTLPAGSILPVRITQTLDSATTQQGQAFSGTIASDVLADGTTVIPQGSTVSGRVEAVQEAAHFKGNSLLSISLTSIARRGGDSIAVTTENFSKEGSGRGKNTAEKVGGGAAVGAILGGIFGGGKGAGIGAAAGGGLGAGANGITRGQQVQIPSETLIRFRLTDPVTVRVRAGASDDAGSPRRPLD